MIQLQVINKILKTKDSSIVTLNNLNESYFSEYPKEFNYIDDHIEKYGSVPDTESFLQQFQNFQIIQVDEPDSYLVAELARDYNKRKVALYYNKIRDCCISDDSDKAIDLVMKAAESISSGTPMRCVDITKDTSRYDDYISRTKDLGKYYVKTGFDELDQIIGGWDRQEELATIVARTNYGKSWVLLKCAVAAVQQGLHAGLYSGEMSARKVGYRFDTLVGHIPNGALNHGDASAEVDYRKYMDDLPDMFSNGGSLKILTPDMIDGPAGVRALRSFIEKEHLDILFIDQHSLLEDDRHGRTPIDKASDISKDLKNLQVLKRIPIVSVSQQNRASTENGLDTTMVAQSDRIGQDSTIVIFLDKKDDTMKLELIKSRDSENGKKLTYKVDFNRGTFTYIPDENDGVGGNSADAGSADFDRRYSSPAPGQAGEDSF